MAHSSQARDLRHLLDVARRLHGLADDAMTCDSDRQLFLTAAAALEARASWMAAALPGDPAGMVHLHQPVDLLI
jgi:hypothetical protein